MQQIPITEKMFTLLFPENEHKFGYTVTVLLDGKKALLIDPGYPAEATEVKAFLEATDISVQKLVISHYHPDHAASATIFPDAEIWASRHYATNYEKCHTWRPEYTYTRPTHLVQDGDTLRFGDFDLTFIETPGHCECNIATIIDNQYIQVGDLIMSTNSGKPLLPVISPGGSFLAHIESLEKVKQLPVHTIIPAHGTVIEGRVEMEREINDRIHYLRQVHHSHGKLELAQCLLRPLTEYERLDWHQGNLEMLQ